MIKIMDQLTLPVLTQNNWKYMDACVLTTVTTDALVLKHQAISIHSVD